MAFFDDLGKKITQTSQDVVQKTKDTAEVIKLNSMISDEEKRINNLYSEVGKKYFELYSDSYDQELENMIIGIKEAKSKIEEYAEQIKKLKGIVRCPNCGGEVQYGAPFCSSCGSRMATQNTSTIVNSSDVKHCTACGAAVATECAFCTHCGTKFEEKSSVETEPPINTQKMCPNCNNEVADDSVFCMNCGTKL